MLIVSVSFQFLVYVLPKQAQSYLFYMYFFNWSIVDLQHFVSFRWMANWFIHTHTYMHTYSFSDIFPLWFIFVVVQSLILSHTLATIWTAARQTPLSFTISQILLKSISVESVMVWFITRYSFLPLDPEWYHYVAVRSRVSTTCKLLIIVSYW